MSKVSIVIPVYNQLKLTITMLNDLLRTHSVDMEIIVVDDGSKELVSRVIPKLFPQVKVLKNDSNVGFARSVNKGIRETTRGLICLLNNDIRLHNPVWLKMMVENMDKYDITAPAMGRLSLPNYEYRPGEVKRNCDINKKEYTYCVGWAILIKREVFDRIGLISEMFGTGFYEDVKFCYDAKNAGFRMGITENTGIEHMYHTTFKAEKYDLAEESKEKRKIFLDLIKKGR